MSELHELQIKLLDAEEEIQALKAALAEAKIEIRGYRLLAEHVERMNRD